jgi:hypothetical protein
MRRLASRAVAGVIFYVLLTGSCSLWMVDIEDTRVTFTVEAQPGTTGAELAEAHAVIGSIRSEPWESAAGFRLTFTLPDGWDSG